MKRKSHAKKPRWKKILRKKSRRWRCSTSFRASAWRNHKKWPSACFQGDGEVAQMQVARPDLNPRVGDADERLLEIGIRESDRFEHRPSGRAMRAGRQRIRSD